MTSPATTKAMMALILRSAALLSLSVGIVSSDGGLDLYPSIFGPYHPSATFNANFSWGSVAIENSARDGPAFPTLQADVEYQCNVADVNAVWGMILGPSEHGVLNNPNDTELYVPAAPAGMIQGAKRWSEISLACPSVAGIVIDDFFVNYVGNITAGQGDACAKCPSNFTLYGNREAGFYCCPGTVSKSHCYGDTHPCCLDPGTSLRCQTLPRCGVNPHNLIPCNAPKGGITLSDLGDIVGALHGKEVDEHGRVNHSSVATTPHLRLMIVWYAHQTPDFNDDGLLQYVDVVNLWLWHQQTTASNMSSEVLAVREKVGSSIEITTGSYLQNSATGWLSPVSFATMVSESSRLHSLGHINGMFVFAGLFVDEILGNSTLEQQYNLESLFNQQAALMGAGNVSVVDLKTGLAVANASVTVMYRAESSDGTVKVTRKVTDRRGTIRFGGYAASGTYELTIEAPRYKSTTKDGCVIHTNQTSFFKIMLPQTDPRGEDKLE